MNSTYSLSKKITVFGMFFIVGFAAAICAVTLVPALQVLILEGSTISDVSRFKMPDSTEAQNLFSNYNTPVTPVPADSSLHPSATTVQQDITQGGYIHRSVIRKLYFSTLAGRNDTTVYYYFGRESSQTVLMLFADPLFHPDIMNNAYRTKPRYCPPECSQPLQDYLRQ